MRPSRSIIAVVLREMDIEGFIESIDAPLNEYDCEAEQVARKLASLPHPPTDQQIAGVIADVFDAWLKLTPQGYKARLPIFAEAARRINARTKRWPKKVRGRQPGAQSASL